MRLPAKESIASVDGFLIARPVRSADDQSRRERPASGQCQGRHGQHIDDVTNTGDNPILAGLIADHSRNGAQRVTEKFTQPRGKSDDSRARA